MYGYVLQDWITIRGGTAGSAGDIIQGESTWMGFSSFQDIVFWLDVREATVLPSGQTLTFYFETSPSKDSNLFTPMHTPSSTGIQIGSTFTPGVQPDPSGGLPRAILASSNTSAVPLATWLRWRVSPSSGITPLPWDVTFRILVAANRVVREPRPLFA